ncbi:hypothetical protein D9615_010169 [Tricholomella constricta]|uniref:Uncharacterized protein n=1 Tax=Tricholomella constricta TaxID=117010 RepID=A0A8H5GRJ8_9AGAR|nr:hypothetical protein D9615_010169 [Tricholomella constricta]
MASSTPPYYPLIKAEIPREIRSKIRILTREHNYDTMNDKSKAHYPPLEYRDGIAFDICPEGANKWRELSHSTLIAGVAKGSTACAAVGLVLKAFKRRQRRFTRPSTRSTIHQARTTFFSQHAKSEPKPKPKLTHTRERRRRSTPSSRTSTKTSPCSTTQKLLALAHWPPGDAARPLRERVAAVKGMKQCAGRT